MVMKQPYWYIKFNTFEIDKVCQFQEFVWIFTMELMYDKRNELVRL